VKKRKEAGKRRGKLGIPPKSDRDTANIESRARGSLNQVGGGGGVSPGKGKGHGWTKERLGRNFGAWGKKWFKKKNSLKGEQRNFSKAAVFDRANQPKR